MKKRERIVLDRDTKKLLRDIADGASASATSWTSRASASWVIVYHLGRDQMNSTEKCRLHLLVDVGLLDEVLLDPNSISIHRRKNSLYEITDRGRNFLADARREPLYRSGVVGHTVERRIIFATGSAPKQIIDVKIGTAAWHRRRG
jgi:hypothetical protein